MRGFLARFLAVFGAIWASVIPMGAIPKGAIWALFLAFALATPNTAHAEPSAFESQSGATKADIAELKEFSELGYKQLVGIQQRLSEAEQRIEGIQTLYATQVKKARDVELALNAERVKTQNLSSENAYLKERLSALESELKEHKKLLAGLESKNAELTKIITDLNEFLINKLDEKAESGVDSTDSNATRAESKTKTASKSADSKTAAFSKDKSKRQETFLQAKELFAQKRYAEAKPIFEWLISTIYRRAEGNFYLGEIAFFERKFKSAIAYYKESAMLQEKASHSPTLLLHTAEAFEALGDGPNAKRFYDALRANYPNSKEAKKIKGQK